MWEHKFPNAHAHVTGGHSGSRWALGRCRVPAGPGTCHSLSKLPSHPPNFGCGGLGRSHIFCAGAGVAPLLRRTAVRGSLSADPPTHPGPPPAAAIFFTQRLAVVGGVRVVREQLPTFFYEAFLYNLCACLLGNVCTFTYICYIISLRRLAPLFSHPM